MKPVIRKVIKVGYSLAVTLPLQWAELGTYVKLTELKDGSLKVEKVK